MAKYIKSHSNYRLSTKHQITNSGTIYERDISTIGGISPLSAGQSKIYSSGNFIITINNEGGASRHIVKNNWLSNSENGDVWNAQVLSNQTSDIEGSVESSLMMKNDFNDLRSFACYGSLYMLIQNAIGSIIDKFPYEICTGDGDVAYEKHILKASLDSSYFDYSGNTNPYNGRYCTSIDYIDIQSSGNPVTFVSVNGKPLYEISNPGGIDIHSRSINTVNSSLKYFANDGYKNYSYYNDRISAIDDDGLDFSWESQYDEYPITGKTIIINDENIFDVNNFALGVIVNGLKLKDEDVVITINGKDGQQKTLSAVTQFLKNESYNRGDILYVKIKNNTCILTEKYCPEPYDKISTITITPELDNSSFKIYAYWDENLKPIYLTEQDNLFLHLRPKPSLSFYDDFIDGLDMFQKALMGVFSKQKYLAQFEIITELDDRTIKQTKNYVFPTGIGDYNIASDGFQMSAYIQELAKIGLSYDERYTDNMYRMLTHESLKNFDWTKNFNGYDNDLDNEYVATGNKFKAMIRIMGYVFDNEKVYIDCIGNNNTITYDDRSNLSDYFLSDLLDSDGWEINNIYPYTLKEYDKETGEEVEEMDWSDLNQSKNFFKRSFSENVTDIIKPYALNEGGWTYICDSANTIVRLDLGDTNSDYYVNTVKKEGKDITQVTNVIKDYVDDTEYTIPQINNSFLKRFKINSKYILRKKGTIDGIESLLGLFGYKSKKWFNEVEYKMDNVVSGKSDTKFVKNSLSRKYPYDYSIKEYTSHSAPIVETWDVLHGMYRIDYLNSCKTIPYNTQEYVNGDYVPYQGLPVAYRDLEGWYLTPTGETNNSGDTSIYKDDSGNLVHARRLYPSFTSDGIYDGDMYYQMNGGWMNMWPYSYDNDSNVIINYTGDVCKETLRNVKQVKTINELLSQDQSDLIENVIYYVNDTSDNFAIIDGYIYPLSIEWFDNKIQYYFSCPVYDHMLTIGQETYDGYLRVSDNNMEDGYSYYYLPALEDGENIKIYFTGNSDESFDIMGYSSSKIVRNVMIDGVPQQEECSIDDSGAFVSYENTLFPLSTGMFINGSYNQNPNDYTHYFKLNYVYNSDTLGVNGWEQLSVADNDYLHVNGTIDKLQGNNPHSSGYGYDNGYEYLSRFSKLFKYASENDYFNTECFSDVEGTLQEIRNIGFNGLVSTSELNHSYNTYQSPDTKIHAFVDRLISNGNSTSYKEYNLDDKTFITEKYPKFSGATDGVTSQIVNTKVVEISFFLSAFEFFDKDAQEEINYIQNKIMPYVEQMIPSGTIMRVNYYIHNYSWVLDKDDEAQDTRMRPEGIYKSYFYWQNGDKENETGIWVNGPES